MHAFCRGNHREADSWCTPDRRELTRFPMSSRPVGLVRVAEASAAWARGQSSLQCATGCPFKNSEAEKDGPTIHGETVAREGSHAKWAGIRRVQHWPLGLVTFLRTQRDGSVWKWRLPEWPTHPSTADRSAQGNSPSNSPKVKQKMVHEIELSLASK